MADRHLVEERQIAEQRQIVEVEVVTGDVLEFQALAIAGSRCVSATTLSLTGAT